MAEERVAVESGSKVNKFDSLSAFLEVNGVLAKNLTVSGSMGKVEIDVAAKHRAGAAFCGGLHTNLVSKETGEILHVAAGDGTTTESKEELKRSLDALHDNLLSLRETLCAVENLRTEVRRLESMAYCDRLFTTRYWRVPMVIVAVEELCLQEMDSRAKITLSIVESVLTALLPTCRFTVLVFGGLKIRGYPQNADNPKKLTSANASQETVKDAMAFLDTIHGGTTKPLPGVIATYKILTLHLSSIHRQALFSVFFCTGLGSWNRGGIRIGGDGGRREAGCVCRFVLLHA